MPGAAYRRRLRSRVDTGAAPVYLAGNGGAGGIVNCEGSELYQIRQTFYTILDMIIRHESFADIIALIQSIIAQVQSRVDYYKVLDIIEHKLLSVVENISDSVSPSIVKARVEYIKTIIEQLPPECGDLGPISTLILEIIDYIIGTVSFTPIQSNLNYIQEYITQKYGRREDICKINTIQDTLLDIICNIGDGVAEGIIGNRVQYVRVLIEQL
jgi:hypothetical protein